MNPQHIIQGDAPAFAKSANKLIAERDVALAIGRISHTEGGLAALIEELPRPVNAPGALIEVRTYKTKDAKKQLASLHAANPMWTVEAVFAAASEEGKAKATLMVVSLRQP